MNPAQICQSLEMEVNSVYNFHIYKKHEGPAAAETGSPTIGKQREIVFFFCRSKWKVKLFLLLSRYFVNIATTFGCVSQSVFVP